MEAVDIINVVRDGIKVLMLVSAPMMLTALVVGLCVSLLQALTQVQEMTLTFVPKIVSMLIVMMLAFPFMLQTLQHFSEELFVRIENIE